MITGTLAKYFDAVVMKRLSNVETDANVSNQHEFNGTSQLRKLFGEDDRKKIPATFLRLDDTETIFTEDGFLSWYDARRAHPTRTEYRLYYPTNSVTSQAVAGDTLFIASRTGGGAVVLVTPRGSTVQSQLIWLFGLPEQPELGFVLADTSGKANRAIGFVETMVLKQIGIEPPQPEGIFAELVSQFGLRFPSTKTLSELARQTSNTSPLDDPDNALLTYMDQEESLFRALEKNIVKERIAKGFGEDVDDFLQFSLSVQNRRKSRAGYALGNHVEAILLAHKIAHKREAKTEKLKGPDFLFPHERAYHDITYDSKGLGMLAVKTSCKDRWRQVMAEADRIAPKHLLTLEASISTAQTSEMISAQIQLVIPSAIQETFTDTQRPHLITFAQFLAHAQIAFPPIPPYLDRDTV